MIVPWKCRYSGRDSLLLTRESECLQWLAYSVLKLIGNSLNILKFKQFNSLFLPQIGLPSIGSHHVQFAAGGDVKFNDREKLAQETLYLSGITVYTGAYKTMKSGTSAASEKEILVMISKLKEIAVLASSNLCIATVDCQWKPPSITYPPKRITTTDLGSSACPDS